MKKLCTVKKVFSSLAVLWIVNIFITSLFYKFTNHPETQHIFGTIGDWIKGTFGETIGNGFTNYGAYIIGGAELLASIVLIIPVVFYIIKLFGFLKNKKTPECLFAIGGIGAIFIMMGAMFFHIFTPLGIEVNNDGGGLFKAAVSIFILSIILSAIHFKPLKQFVCSLKK